MRGSILALVVLGCTAACVSGPCLAAQGDVTLSGTFVWSNAKDKVTPIKAVFTPNGDKKWTVVYTFNWSGAQSWKGTAEGDLSSGEVKGDATHSNGKRKFTFSGTAKNGQIDCTHNETTSGKPQPTGSMTVKKE